MQAALALQTEEAQLLDVSHLGQRACRVPVADRQVALFPQRVIGEVVRLQILADVAVGPVEDGMKMRGMIPGAVAFDVGDDDGESPVTMLKALESGRVDVMITWEPAVSGFLRDFPDLEVVAVPNERALGAPEQYTFPMSMGVREGDEAFKEQLDEIIANHQAELTAILKDNGVRLYTPQSPNSP